MGGEDSDYSEGKTDLLKLKETKTERMANQKKLLEKSTSAQKKVKQLQHKLGKMQSKIDEIKKNNKKLKQDKSDLAEKLHIAKKDLACSKKRKETMNKKFG